MQERFKEMLSTLSERDHEFQTYNGEKPYKDDLAKCGGNFRTGVVFFYFQSKSSISFEFKNIIIGRKIKLWKCTKCFFIVCSNYTYYALCKAKKMLV